MFDIIIQNTISNNVIIGSRDIPGWVVGGSRYLYFV